MSFANAQLTNVGHEGDWSEIVYDLVPDPFAPTFWQLVRRFILIPSLTRFERSEGNSAAPLPRTRSAFSLL